MNEHEDDTGHQLPGENLVRAVYPADIELRSDNGDDAPVMHGHFAVFDEWTEINSFFEGNFLERIAPGAMSKTLDENRKNIRVLFQHGRDPQIGDKVLGVPTELEEDDRGARYEVPLFDTAYNRELEPGLRAGAYGASFRFSVVKEEIDQDPPVSDHNPKGLPERTIKEARVMEFGPVTFPAYPGATAGVRSLTDEFMPGGRFASGADASAEQPERTSAEEEAPTTSTAQEPTHSHDASRDTPQPDERRSAPTTTEVMEMQHSVEEMRSRQRDIKRELEEIYLENKLSVLSATDQARWDELEAEHEELRARIESDERMQKRLLAISDGGDEHRESGGNGFGSSASGTGTFVTKRAGRAATPDNIWDMTEYHRMARDQQHMFQIVGEGARRAIETFRYPHPDADRDRVNAHIERVLREDSPDKEIAHRILHCGSELYKRAFFKSLTNQPLTSDESRALAVGAVATGQAAVPIDLDPTLIPTSNKSFNPIRAISRVVTTTSYKWDGVTSGGVTANYRAEAAAMTDNSPTLTQPTIWPERCDVFIPFSWELAGDWGALESALAVDIQDAKDDVESLKFSVGTGHASNEPRGVLVGHQTNGINAIGSSGATAFAVADIFALEDALPARHIPGAAWVATNGMFQKVRQFDTQGGANFWTDLNDGNPPRLLGYPAYKATNVGTAGPALTSSAKWGVFGDFSRYVIVDRVGLSVRLMPDLVSTAATAGNLSMPTGQSGLVAFWRNSAGVVDAGAFRVGTIT